MTFALTLLVLLSPGEEPIATAVAAAIRTTLGSDTVLALRFVATPPTDDAVLALARDTQSATIALITWSDSSHELARLRVYSQITGAWTARDLEFTGHDPAEEKGRAIGFNLASMLPEVTSVANKSEPAAAPPPVEPPSAEPAAPPIPPAPPIATRNAPDTGPPAATVAQTAAPTPVPSTADKPEPSTRWTVAVEATAQGVVAINGEGTSVGGALGGQYKLGEHLALCLGAGLRIGHIEALEARLVAVDFVPGIAWRSGDLGAGRRWGLQIQLAAFARLQSVKRPAEGSAPAESHGRFVPGASLAVELTYALTAGVTLLANARLNAVLGQTDVYLGTQEVAEFAPVELGLGLGARTYF